MSEQSKHIPGPWKLGDDSWPAHTRPCVIAGPFTLTEGKISHTMNVQVATVHLHGEETEANARLIAAAPELLEACKAILDRNVSMAKAQQLASIAIAKAEGGAK